MYWGLFKLNVNEIRKDFPSILSKTNKGLPIVYFDNSATSLKPKCVLDSMVDVYINAFGNANRGAHIASVRASDVVDKTRGAVKNFIGATDLQNIIFTKNATESLNIISFSYAMKNLKKGDTILIGIDSHHANLVPWKILSEKKGINLEYFYVDENGNILMDDFKKKLLNNPKIVSFTPITNTFGVVHDYRKIIELSKNVNAKVIVDASQSMTHIKFDVVRDDIDFLVFSGHKMLAPQGVGVLYASKNVIDDMEPFLYGGDMVDYVFEDEVTFKKHFSAFEGGTQNVSAISGLFSAIEYINSIGISSIVNYENKLKEYFLSKSKEFKNFILYGSKELNNRVCIFSFNVEGVHAHDTATILDSFGIAVRSGNHCSQPFMRKMNLISTTRASLYFYNTIDEIDYFFDKIEKIGEILKI